MKMKIKNISCLLIIICSNFAMAIPDEIFINSFEKLVFPIKLNDTGIIFSGKILTGNDELCQTTTIQDCFHGRDLIDNNPSDGHAGFSFTKLATNGDTLPANDLTHSCVRDNVTGLIWEVKSTNPGSIHYNETTYRWGGVTAIGSTHLLRKGIFYSDWTNLVNTSNNNSLCGLSNWRLPTGNELSSIVNYNKVDPTIDTDLFPNTTSSEYWTSSPSSFDPTMAWYVGFFYGSQLESERTNTHHVRLVSSGQ